MKSELIEIIYMLFLFLTVTSGALIMIITFEKRRNQEKKEQEKLS